MVSNCWLTFCRSWSGSQGGTHIFSSDVGSGPISTLHPKNFQEFQAPPKNIWNLSNPQKYPPPQFCTLTLRKGSKMHRNDPYSPILWYQQNLHTQKISIFRKTPKNIEIQNFEPKKVTRAYVCIKISESPPPPGIWVQTVCKGYQQI